MHNSALFPIILSASTFLSYSAIAACTANPDCAALGYTKTSCASGDLIMKCPFDTAKVQCVPQTCETIGKKACGDICVKSGGCCSNADCTSGKVCDNYVCKEVTCAVGDIYYSDKTCSANLVSGKNPIGVVGYVTNGGKNGVVVALDSKYDGSCGSAGSNEITWGCYGTDLSLKNNPNETSLKSDFAGKSNTDVIAAQCGKYTAAYYCKYQYKKGGISEWYLPAYGELYAALYTNLTAVNGGFDKIAANDSIIQPIGIAVSYWASSENDIYGASKVNTYSGWDSVYKNNKGFARCVLAF